MAIPRIDPYPMPTDHHLPPNTVEWTPDPTRAALLVHDMQDYFLRPFPDDGPPLPQLVSNIAALRDAFHHAGAPVLYTAQPGGMSAADRGLLRDFWGPGMPAGEDHRRIHPALTPSEGDTVLTKWRASAFFRTELLRLLRGLGRDQLVVCGVYVHVGVLVTAHEAFANDIQTFVVGDAVAGFSRDSHLEALDHLTRQCASALSTPAVTAAIAEGALR